MKRYLLSFTFLIFALAGWCQMKERVIISSTRISIEKPENALIPKHTSTIYLDSTIEFMIVEFPNVEIVKEWMAAKSYPIDGPDIKETFALKVSQGVCKVFVSEFNTQKDIIYCYVGDETYGILSSCIFKRTDTRIKQQVLDVVQSMKIVDRPAVDWDAYLSFSYDDSNALKVVNEKYVTGIRFTPNGQKNDSLFNKTNITALQFPPAPFVKSSKDLLLAMIAAELTELTINEVLFDGETQINDQEAYKFWAKVSVGEVDFEMIYVAFFDPQSSVILNCHIIDSQYQQEVLNFVESIKLKRDGY